MNPNPNSDNAPPEWAVKAADLSCDAFWRHTAWVAPKELKQELAAIIARHAPTPPPPVAAGRAGVELVERLKEIARYAQRCTYLDWTETLTDAIAALSRHE